MKRKQKQRFFFVFSYSKQVYFEVKQRSETKNRKIFVLKLIPNGALGFSSSRIRVCFYCGRGKRRGKHFTDTRTKRIGLGANSDSAEDYACSSRSRVSSFTTSKKQTGFWYVFAEFAASKLGENVPKSSLRWWTAFIFHTVLELIRTVLQGTRGVAQVAHAGQPLLQTCSCS